MRILFSLFLVLFLALGNNLLAQDFSAQNSKYSPTIYGDKFTYEEDKFYYFNELEGVLFLKGKIEKGMYKDFRQAIADNNIHTLVLESPGGSVFEGVAIAETVFDRKIKTYIRKNQFCASACSFIFLSGKQRYSLGKLGVHQIAYGEEFSKSKEEVGKIAEAVQTATSAIVQVLEENDTPGFVYKYMFRKTANEMYYFNEDELNQLGNSNISPQDKLHFNRIDNFTKDYNSHIIKQQCDKNPNSCTTTQLCSRASKNNKWRTSPDAARFVKLAKSKGKRCGVPIPKCPENIKKCNKEYLCTYGTTGMDAGKTWLNNSFGDEAKLRGYSCGIITPKLEIKKQSCSQNFKVCNREELCKFATKGSGNNKSWETHTYFKKHVDYAKKLSYSCNVNEDTCYEKSSKCNDKELCQVATKNTSKGKEWKNNTYWSKHVADAKRRGLSCGIVKSVNRVTCSVSSDHCSSDMQLCQFATMHTSKGKEWKNNTYWSNHVAEAKRRGLSCGVKKQVLKKTCTQDATSCNDPALCKKATTTISGEKSWDKRTSWASYVTEAKRRGLSCGVPKKGTISNYKATIIRIQDRLNTLRCDAGPVDGVLGSKTLSALMRWKARGGIYTVNKVDVALLNKLNKTSVRCRKKGASLSVITGVTDHVSYIRCNRTYISDKSGKYLDRLTKEFVFAYSIDRRKYKLVSNNIIYVPSLGNQWRKLTKYETRMDYQNSPFVRAVYNDGKYPRRLTYLPKRGKLTLRVSKYIQGTHAEADYDCISFVP